MTKIKINSDGKEILVPDTLWVTAVGGAVGGFLGLMVGLVVGAISDVVTWRNGDY